jgi:Cys-tRNA(Pro)/Cys-tRNA(Cys) deacylase
MATKLNSMRLLDSHKVSYDVLTYDDNIHDATDVARQLGIPAEQVYKTLVVERVGGGKPVLIMIASNRHLDLKKFAAAIGEKKVNMAAHADAEKLTGLKVGGIGALALVQKHWDVYLDKPAAELDNIAVSAGQRGTNLRVPVKDLIRILNARLVEATESPQS